MRLALLPAVLLLGASAQAQSIVAGDPALNVQTGGRTVLDLDAGPGAAGDLYLVLGSATGTAPGLPLGAGSLPLVVDAYTNLTLAQPNGAALPNSFGVLDSAGQGSTELVVPALAVPSISLFHAFVVIEGGAVVGVSDAAEVVVGPGSLTVESGLDGATLQTATVDVTGLIPASLDGGQVLVAGTPADLLLDPTGFERFTARDVRLLPGANTIDVVASAPGAGSDAVSISIEHDVLDANNVVVVDGFAYAALGVGGIGVVDLERRTGTRIAPPAGSGSVDDVAVADGLLFALDAAGAGNLSVFSLADGGVPALVDGPTPVPVSPFAGVSAGGGRVVTSGGTSLLRVYTYDAAGQLSASFASADLGTGQPDVLVDPTGDQAFVSTDFSGTVGGSGFGITIINLFNPPASPTVFAQIGIPGAGFTPGGGGPANFAIESARVDDLLLVASGAGLTVVDLAAQTVLPFGIGISGVSVDASSTRAFVVGTTPLRSLVRVDISNPAAPQVLASDSFAAPGTFTGVATDGEHVVVAGNAGGLFVFDAE
ncbi:MAG: hypothetical protein AAFZ65_01620 [Planctomycetota bacterium]